ncbi:hypothetical protein [Streptomyces sp. NPDC007355]|uniref:hypothetical protein n=1 Tax=Streptomyces sp. NPDC007355 TaxID=3364778 RepID=UPI0036902DCA
MIPRIPRAAHVHATIHCHPTDTWHLTWTRPDEPGIVLATAMPRRTATAAAVPDLDRDLQVAVWAR